MQTIRLTAAQAMVRFLAAQQTSRSTARSSALFAGVLAIFGHGNVAGLGEALYAARDIAADLPRPQRTGDGARGDRLRQGLAPAAHDGLHDLDRPRRDQHGHRRRAGACQPPARAAACPATCSPAAAPIRFCSRSRISATARSAPMIASARCRAISTASSRPEQIVPALTRALAVLTDPAECGPVTLAFCQDVQAEAYDYPESFFAARVHRIRRQRARRRASSRKRRRSCGPRARAAGRLRRRRALFRGRARADRRSAPSAAFRSPRRRRASRRRRSITRSHWAPSASPGPAPPTIARLRPT